MRARAHVFEGGIFGATAGETVGAAVAKPSGDGAETDPADPGCASTGSIGAAMAPAEAVGSRAGSRPIAHGATTATGSSAAEGTRRRSSGPAIPMNSATAAHPTNAPAKIAKP